MQRPRNPVIAHVLNSLDGGGTERQLVSLLHAMEGGPLRHVVCTLRGAGSLAARLPGAVACRPLDVPGGRRAAWWPLARVLRETGASLVHARNTGTWFDATVAARLCPGTRLVLGFHGLETGDTLSPRQRKKARFGLRAGAHFTTPGESGRRLLCDQAGLPAERIAVLANGVDLTRFRPRGPSRAQEVRAALGLRPEDFVIGGVGSLTPIKRFDLLLDAAAIVRGGHPDVRVLLVGDGPLRASLAARAAALGMENNVWIAGHREDVPDLLSAMDVFVCCSDSEGSSNAVLEAMACGRTVVATDVGENARLIRDGVDGVILRKPSAAELADVLVRLRSAWDGRPRPSEWDGRPCPSFGVSFGESARAQAQRFSLERSARAYAEHYAALLPSSGVVSHVPGAPAPVASVVLERSL